MVINFFSTGTNAPRSAKNYLEASPDFEVLHGDSELTTQLAESLDFKYKYTSGVMSLSRGEHLTTEQEADLINRFENIVGAGLDEKPSMYFVKHTDKGRDEYHFVIANVDLNTGNAFTPYLHKLDKNLFDDFKNMINYEFELSDPNAPQHRKTVADISAFSKPDKKQVQQAANDITNLAYATGLAKNRNDIIGILESEGFEITRQTKTSISIKHGKGSIRLKGQGYEKSYNIDNDNDAGRQVRTDNERYKREFTAQYEQSAQRFTQRLQERTKRNADRYTNRTQQFEQYSEQQNKGNEKSTEQQNSNSVIDNNTNKHAINGCARPLHIPDESKNERHKLDTDNDRTDSKRSENLHDKQKPDGLYLHKTIECEFKGRVIGQLLDKGDSVQAQGFKSDKAAAFNVVKQAQQKGWKSMHFNGNDDFLRAAYKQALNKKIEVTAKDEHQQKILDEVKKAEQKQVQQARNSASNHMQKREFSAEYKERKASQLDNFKTQINLADYAENIGFEKDVKASSRSYAVMRNGGEKIIIHKGQNGHFVFSSNNGQNGTIIDFVQQQKGYDLNTVRKELSDFEPGLALQNPAPELKKHTIKIKKSDYNASLIKNKTAELKTPNEWQQRYISYRSLNINDYDFKIDARNNLAFPYLNANNEICGYELKNQDFTGQAAGGEKGLFYANKPKIINEIIVCESAIDAISKMKLDKENKNKNSGGRLYIATGGDFSDDVSYRIEAMAETHGAEIVASFDNDEGGKKLTEKLPCDKKETPNGSKDWNDVLKKRSEQSTEKEPTTGLSM